MERNTRIPNTRLSRFYDEDDFKLEMDMATELIEEDANFTVVIYRIDKTKSNVDIYGESINREVRFLAPVELKVLLLLEQAENKTYGDTGRLRYQEHGTFSFHVLTTQLKQKNIDIQYGDIVAYSDREDNLKYFEVFDEGKINADNKHTQFGYSAFYRTIKCNVVDPNQFDGI